MTARGFDEFCPRCRRPVAIGHNCPVTDEELYGEPPYLPYPPDVITAPTVPLHTVPVGGHVVYEGEVWRVAAYAAPDAVMGGYARLEQLLGTRHRTGDTPAIPLDGDHPVPLSECEGRDVWHEGHIGRWQDDWRTWTWTPSPPPASSLRYWPIARPEQDEPPQRWEARRNESVGGWQLVAPDGSVCADLIADEWQARRIAAFLNEHCPDGLPDPEPERSLQTILDRFDGPIYADDLLLMFDEADWVLVDRRALADAIEWLRGPPVRNIGGSRGECHARALLDAIDPEGDRG